MTTAISIENVSKTFRIYHEKFDSLKERILHLGKVPYEEFFALKDVSMEVGEGKTTALLGHNGSGKSTLLKCIAGIQPPTSGQVRVKGRMASMLELGAGFHPDLTGRENVYLNASLLGLDKNFVDGRFDEIVAFAELDKFIDNQVKFYSSGMYVRLGFAVAVNMDPDILLVDEVLAVGDELFQRKCLDRIRRFQKEGRTIVVVTHAVETVREICHEAAVFDKGELVAFADPTTAIRAYRDHLYARYGEYDTALEITDESEKTEKGLPEEERRNFKVKVDKVTLVPLHSEDRAYFLPDDQLDVVINVTVSEKVEDVGFGIAIYDMDGRFVYGINTHQMGVAFSELEPQHMSVTFHLERLSLLDGEYFITIGVHNQDGFIVYDWHEQRYRF